MDGFVDVGDPGDRTVAQPVTECVQLCVMWSACAVSVDKTTIPFCAVCCCCWW